MAYLDRLGTGSEDYSWVTQTTRRLCQETLISSVLRTQLIMYDPELVHTTAVLPRTFFLGTC